MSNYADGIGFVNDTLGIVSWSRGLFHDPHPKGPSVMVKVGNPGDGESGADGDVSLVHVWDRRNGYLAQTKGRYLRSGDFEDIVIDTHTDITQAGYIGVTAGDDSVCIAWITVTQSDGTAGGLWSGDVGYQCDQHWYEQMEVAGCLGEKCREDYVPRCTWLSAKKDDDIPSASMTFRVDAYGEKARETLANDEQCSSTVWEAEEGPASPKDGTSKKRSLRPRAAWMEKVLVVSDKTQHRAENLCSSDTSWGPDFIGTDGFFCDMDTHTLSPLCSTEDVDGCVSIDDENQVVTKQSVGRKRIAERSFKSYEKVNRWR